MQTNFLTSCDAENIVNFFLEKKRENTVNELVGLDLRVGRGPPSPPSRYATGRMRIGGE